jgi:hypothetical protein
MTVDGRIYKKYHKEIVDVAQTEAIGSGRRGEEFTCFMKPERPFVFNNSASLICLTL